VCARSAGRDVRAQLGVDDPGLDDADAHALREELLPQRLGEGVHAELGEAVHGGPRPRDPARGRADVHDVGDTPGRLRGGADQVGDRRPRHVQHGLHVDRQHAIPLPLGRVGDGPEEHQPRVVDHGVEPPQRRHGARNRLARLPRVRDVALEGERGPAPAPILAASASSRSRRLASTATDAPSAASASAVASPIPLLAPVTSATVPRRRPCSPIAHLLFGSVRAPRGQEQPARVTWPLASTKTGATVAALRLLPPTCPTVRDPRTLVSPSPPAAPLKEQVCANVEV
jgi:hypothetical protein